MLKSDNHKKNHVPFYLILFFVFLAVLFILGWKYLSMTSIVSFMQALVTKYGLFGGFAVSFFGSLWFFQFPYEILLAPILEFSRYPLLYLIVFALAATGADVINFYSGKKLGEIVLIERIGAKTVAKLNHILSKWGVAVMVFFGFIGPVTSYDLLALVIGAFSKMRFKKFISITLIVRMIHFSVVLVLADLIFKSV